jgi:tetratricopeptide (TPR) repeat protein
VKKLFSAAAVWCVGLLALSASPTYTLAAPAIVHRGDLDEATAKLFAAKGPDAYAALRAVWDTWDRADPNRVEEVLTSATRDARLTAPAQNYAAMLVSYSRLRRGDVTSGRAKTKALGYVDQWVVTGPFDNEGRSGYDNAFGPEADFGSPITPGKAYSGKERPVRSRVVPKDAFPYGYLDFGSLVRPDRKVCVYATSFVSGKSKGTAARDATVWVGAAGAFKLFWNGALALSDEAERRLDAERFAATVRVLPGQNNLTVKVCGTDAPPVIAVRLANVKGDPDPDLQVTSALEASAEAAETVKALGAAKAKRAVTAKGGIEGPMQAFQRLTGGAHPSADELESFARYLVATGGDDPTTHQARNLAQRAADAAPTIPRLLLAAELAEDHNQRARWVERAERLSGGKTDVRVLLARATLAKESLHPRDAFPLYQDILRVEPDNVDAIRGAVEMDNDVGLRRTALALLEGAVARNPSSVLLLNMYSSELRALGRATEAAEVESRYAAYRFDDRTLISRDVDLGVARQNKAATERWVERLLAIEPDGQWAFGEAARAYRALGEPDRAVGAYQRALELSPEDVGTLRALADLQGELGRRNEQVALLGRVLAVQPQDKDVREYLEHLEPTGSRMDEAFAWSDDRFLKERTAPNQGMNRRMLLDLTVTTVFENGLSSKFRQIVFQPLTDSAAALARQYAFGYQADSERVQLRGARVFRGDGTVDEAIESGEAAADDPEIAMYTSARTFYVQFPRLEPGDVVELRYRTDTVTAQNSMADYFGEVTYLQGQEAVSHAEYVLVTPKSRKLYTDATTVPGVKQTTEDRGNLTVRRFFADKLPGISPEPAMPPWPSVLGFVHVSTYGSYADVGRWYWSIAKEQFDLDDETRKLARSIAHGKETPLEKVKAVYDWVVQNTRYVALEFGIYGYKPRRCVQTVTRGWGDCKDKATVIVTLLKELGIDSTIVIVRSGMRGDFDSKVASLAPFDHAIAYVPSLDLYLDGTAEYTGSSELPAMDAGAIAMRVNQGKAELVRLPIPNPERNVRRRDVVATLRKDGSAQVELALDTRGTAASSWRRRFHAESTRRERVTEELGQEFPGFELDKGATGITVNDLDNLEEPVTVKVRATATRFARKEGDTLSVPVTPGFRLTPTYASLSTRRLPVKLPPVGALDDTFTVTIPAGYRVVSLPDKAAADSPFGSYSITAREEDGRVVVQSRVVVKAVTVPQDKYAAWKQFCAEVDSALVPRLVLGPK